MSRKEIYGEMDDSWGRDAGAIIIRRPQWSARCPPNSEFPTISNFSFELNVMAFVNDVLEAINLSFVATLRGRQ